MDWAPVWYRVWRARRADRRWNGLSMADLSAEYNDLLYSMWQAQEVRRHAWAASEEVPLHHLRGRSRGMHERLYKESRRASDLARDLRGKVDSLGRHVYWREKQEGQVDEKYGAWARKDQEARLEWLTRERP
jgi:hypothetical protein